MKYYLLHSLGRIKQYSQKLDAKAVLYNKPWIVFNDSGDKQIFIFRPKDELLISHNGEVTKASWELLPTGSLLLEITGKSYLFNPSFIDNQFFVLNLDGHIDSLIMIYQQSATTNIPKSLTEINNYLEKKYPPPKPISETERLKQEMETNKEIFLSVIIIMIVLALALAVVVVAAVLHS